MITEIRIKNFKSIHKLRFELGRVNVLIGANGSGKSNILEAIVMGAAAHNVRLDKEFLASRGIRVTPKPQWIRSAFEQENVDLPVRFMAVDAHGENLDYTIQNSNESIYSTWVNEEFQDAYDTLKDTLRKLANDVDFAEQYAGIPTKYDTSRKVKFDFMIFSPEESVLRQFDEVEQSVVLGKNGAGLFTYLQHLSQNSKDTWEELKSLLGLLDWFDDMKIPEYLLSGERILEIRDRYVDPDLSYFDQRSTNEGFLFLLFYFALMIGEETPKFFAIDNIDASLNPKLCRRLIKEIARLAKKYDKQVIVTTHNPAVLDGLNVDDPDQRLFVVWRNGKGHTGMKRTLKPQPRNGSKPLKLSEAFVRGYLGGLPDNFRNHPTVREG